MKAPQAKFSLNFAGPEQPIVTASVKIAKPRHKIGIIGRICTALRGSRPGHWSRICQSARIGIAVRIGPWAKIGSFSVIGDGTFVGNWCEVGDVVEIGNNCHLGHWSRIGNKVKIPEGTVLGAHTHIADGVTLDYENRYGDHDLVTTEGIFEDHCGPVVIHSDDNEHTTVVLTMGKRFVIHGVTLSEVQARVRAYQIGNMDWLLARQVALF